MRTRTEQTALHNKIKQLYTEGTPRNEIVKLLGVSPEYVTYIAKRLGIQRSMSEAKRKYPINEHVFDVIDNEQAAYWLGFITADGCSFNGTLRFELAAKDKGHLEKIRNWIQPEKPIRTPTRPHGFPVAALEFHSVHMCKVLGYYGILRDKTHNLGCRPELPEDLLRHYYRGFVDGDGNLAKRLVYDKKWNKWSYKCYFGAVGTEVFIKEFQDWIEKVTNLSPTRTWKQNPDVPVVYVSRQGTYRVASIIKILYENCSIYLDRKHATAMDILEFALDMKDNPYSYNKTRRKTEKNKIEEHRPLQVTPEYLTKQRNVSQAFNRSLMKATNRGKLLPSSD